MKNIIPLDISKALFNISENYTASALLCNDDNPECLSGLNVRIISMETDPPYGGEIHFGGDEMIHVMSGVLEVVSDWLSTFTINLVNNNAIVKHINAADVAETVASFLKAVSYTHLTLPTTPYV